jgi:hypothetical protein
MSITRILYDWPPSWWTICPLTRDLTWHRRSKPQSTSPFSPRRAHEVTHG